MKKILILLPLLFMIGFAGELDSYAIMFPDSILVGTDTLVSYPFRITMETKNIMARTVWLLPDANDTCSLSAYFTQGPTNDTTKMDSLFYSPTGAPGDSTLFTGFIVQTDARPVTGMLYPDVQPYARVRLILTGEATDTVWIAHSIKDKTKTYSRLDFAYWLN